LNFLAAQGYALDVAAAFSMFLDKRALGSTMISCRSTIIAAIVIAIGDQGQFRGFRVAFFFFFFFFFAYLMPAHMTQR
jgi:hypothetical protein